MLCFFLDVAVTKCRDFIAVEWPNVRPAIVGADEFDGELTTPLCLTLDAMSLWIPASSANLFGREKS